MIIKMCADCGVQLIPFVGHFLPCACGAGDDDNRHLVDVEVPEEIVARRLWSMYQSAPHSIREMFDHYALYEEKILLYRGKKDAEGR